MHTYQHACTIMRYIKMYVMVVETSNDCLYQKNLYFHKKGSIALQLIKILDTNSEGIPWQTVKH